jgi:hypothetical protein
MVINSLLGRRLNNDSLWAQGFADDIAIVINGKFLSTVCELIQKSYIDGPFHQQQEVSGLQKAYTIWNGIAVEKSS